MLENIYKEENKITSDIKGIIDAIFKNVVSSAENDYETFKKYNFCVKESELLLVKLKNIETTARKGNITLTRDESLKIVDETISDKLLRDFIHNMYSNTNDGFEVIVKTVYSHYKNFKNNYAVKYNLTNDEILVMSVLKDTQEYIDDAERYFGIQNMLNFLVVLGGSTMNKESCKQWNFNNFIDNKLFNTEIDDLFRISITSLIVSFTLDSNDDEYDVIVDKIYEKGNEILNLCINLLKGTVEDLTADMFGFEIREMDSTEVDMLKSAADNIIELIKK